MVPLFLSCALFSLVMGQSPVSQVASYGQQIGQQQTTGAGQIAGQTGQVANQTGSQALGQTTQVANAPAFRQPVQSPGQVIQSTTPTATLPTNSPVNAPSNAPNEGQSPDYPVTLQMVTMSPTIEFIESTSTNDVVASSTDSDIPRPEASTEVITTSSVVTDDPTTTEVITETSPEQDSWTSSTAATMLAEVDTTVSENPQDTINDTEVTGVTSSQSMESTDQTNNSGTSVSDHLWTVGPIEETNVENVLQGSTPGPEEERPKTTETQAYTSPVYRPVDLFTVGESTGTELSTFGTTVAISSENNQTTSEEPVGHNHQERQLWHEKQQLVHEKQQLRHERQQLKHERDQLKRELQLGEDFREEEELYQQQQKLYREQRQLRRDQKALEAAQREFDQRPLKRDRGSSGRAGEAPLRAIFMPKFF